MSLGDFKKRAHMAGVAESETHRETTMAMLNVTANSRNSRPMMPPIRRMGINTEINEMLIDKTVGPISWEPFKAASKGESPASR